MCLCVLVDRKDLMNWSGCCQCNVDAKFFGNSKEICKTSSDVRSEGLYNFLELELELKSRVQCSVSL